MIYVKVEREKFNRVEGQRMFLIAANEQRRDTVQSDRQQRQRT